jgi:hypothetical protein
MTNTPTSLKQTSLASAGPMDQLTNIDDLDAKVEAMIKQADEVHARVVKRQDGIIDETAASIEQQSKAAAALQKPANIEAEVEAPAAADSMDFGSGDSLMPPVPSEASPSGAGVGLSASGAGLSAKETLARAIEEAMRKAPTAEEIATRLKQDSSAVVNAASATTADAVKPEATVMDEPLQMSPTVSGEADLVEAEKAFVSASEDEFADAQEVVSQAEANGEVSMVEPTRAEDLAANAKAAGSKATQTDLLDQRPVGVGSSEVVAQEPVEEPAQELGEELMEHAAQPVDEVPVQAQRADLDAQLENALKAAEAAKAVVAPVPAPVVAAPVISAAAAAAAKASAQEAATVKALDDQLAKALAAAGDDEFADGGVLVEDHSLEAIAPVAAVVAAPVQAAAAPAAAHAPEPAPAAVARVEPPKPAVSAPTSSAIAPPTPIAKPAAPKPAVAVAPPTPVAPPAPPAPPGPTLADRFWQVATPVVEPIAKRLGKLPVAMQQTFGWVGLSTLFVAGCTWIYVLGFQETRPASQIIEEQKAKAAAHGKKGDGEHGAGGTDAETHGEKAASGH